MKEKNSYLCLNSSKSKLISTYIPLHYINNPPLKEVSISNFLSVIHDNQTIIMVLEIYFICHEILYFYILAIFVIKAV